MFLEVKLNSRARTKLTATHEKLYTDTNPSSGLNHGGANATGCTLVLLYMELYIVIFTRCITLNSLYENTTHRRVF